MGTPTNFGNQAEEDLKQKMANAQKLAGRPFSSPGNMGTPTNLSMPFSSPGNMGTPANFGNLAEEDLKQKMANDQMQLDAIGQKLFSQYGSDEGAMAQDPNYAKYMAAKEMLAKQRQGMVGQQGITQQQALQQQALEQQALQQAAADKQAAAVAAEKLQMRQQQMWAEEAIKRQQQQAADAAAAPRYS
jgi:hypothetical protein